MIAHARATLLDAVTARTLATHRLMTFYDRCYAAQTRGGSVLQFEDVAYRLSHELPALHPDRVLEVYYRHLPIYGQESVTTEFEE